MEFRLVWAVLAIPLLPDLLKRAQARRHPPPPRLCRFRAFSHAGRFPDQWRCSRKGPSSRRFRCRGQRATGSIVHVPRLAMPRASPFAQQSASAQSSANEHNAFDSPRRGNEKETRCPCAAHKTLNVVLGCSRWPENLQSPNSRMSFTRPRPSLAVPVTVAQIAREAPR